MTAIAPKFEGLSLNTVTVRDRWQLSECIEGCLRAGYGGISPSRADIRRIGPVAARRMLRDSGLVVTGLNRGILLAQNDCAHQRDANDDTRRAIDEAAAIEARCLVVVAGGLPTDSKSIGNAREEIRDIVEGLLPYAEAASVKLAIEPLNPVFASDRSVICDLTSANNLAESLDWRVGIVLDTYHIWWDPRINREIKRVGPRVAAYHVNDWLRCSTDRLNDRGMIGDGVIDIKLISDDVCESGYKGFIEVEIMSTNWWAEDPDIVLAIARDRIAGILTA